MSFSSIPNVGNDWALFDVPAMLLLVVLLFLGREFDLRFGRRIKARFGNRFVEPSLSPEQSRMGLSVLLVLLIVVGFLVTVLQNACPPFE